jgi:dynein heavy chain, axonemal
MRATSPKCAQAGCALHHVHGQTLLLSVTINDCTWPHNDVYKPRPGPLQAEAIEIRRKSDVFSGQVEDYRRFFLKRAPFSVPGGELKLDQVQPAYRILDAFHHGRASPGCGMSLGDLWGVALTPGIAATCVQHNACVPTSHSSCQQLMRVPGAGSLDGYVSVTAMVKDSKQLQESQDLFEIYVQDYMQLHKCNEELLYLKSLWDTVGTVMYTFSDWYKTAWDKIDVEFLVEETKKLSKDIKTLNKAVRNYEVFRLLEESLKAMLTSLPLVQDLHHPAMRDRHWLQLMQATGKHFVMDDKFCLGDLLALELHNFVDACSEIVDRAQKELIIEKALKKIEDAWAGLNLIFSAYQDTDIMALQASLAHSSQPQPVPECNHGRQLTSCVLFHAD